jgi:hypothetical protein
VGAQRLKSLREGARDRADAARLGPDDGVPGAVAAINVMFDPIAREYRVRMTLHAVAIAPSMTKPNGMRRMPANRRHRTANRRRGSRGE